MSYLKNRKSFPKEITSYDLLKTVAVLLMIVDHIGAYIYPDNEWFRVFGRMCVPIWFFLVGYARSRDVSSPMLWGGGIALLVANAVVGMPILPLNILFTIMAVRLVLDGFIAKFLNDKFDTFMGCLVLIMLCFPLMFVVEYGIAVLPLAIAGYFARNKEALNFAKWKSIVILFAIAAFFSISQVFLSFDFSVLQFSVMFLGVYIGVVYLYVYFEPHVFKRNSWFISFFGRYTLEIYVFHLIVLKLVAIVTGSKDDLEWFNAHILPVIG